MSLLETEKCPQGMHSHVLEQQAVACSCSRPLLPRSALPSCLTLQDFLVQLGDTLQGNEGCLDTINVSGALQKLAAACCAVPPLGEILLSARALFQQLIELALQLEATFKIDAINNTIGALAKLSNHGTAQNLLPVAGSDEAFNIQASLQLQFKFWYWNLLRILASWTDNSS